MADTGKTGFFEGLADGAETPLRLTREALTATADGIGRYAEATIRKRRFSAANQAAQAVSVALATTYTGIVVSNPAGSPVDLVIDRVSYALSVAPAGIAPIGLIGGWAAAGVTVHTAALAPTSDYIGDLKGFGLADSQATIPTPTWLHFLQGGFTAAALYAAGVVDYDLGGLFVVPPGGFIAIGALTAVTGFGSIHWQEVRRLGQ